MKCFYIFSFYNKEVIQESGVALLSKLVAGKERGDYDISLKNVYDSKLDNEEFRQCVIKSILRQISISYPIKYEGICPILNFCEYLVLWRISIRLNSVFAMVIDADRTFPLRGKYVLDFVTEWSEKSLFPKKEETKGEESKDTEFYERQKTDEILVLLHLVAPSGQLQLLNDDFLSNIELLMLKGRKMGS